MTDPGHDRRSRRTRWIGPALILVPSRKNRKKPDVAGIDGTRTTGPGAFPVFFFGTSAAAPHVAGVAALLLEVDPGATPAELRRALKRGAVDLGGPLVCGGTRREDRNQEHGPL